jgi:hypothetical protein
VVNCFVFLQDFVNDVRWCDKPLPEGGLSCVGREIKCQTRSVLLRVETRRPEWRFIDTTQ